MSLVVSSIGQTSNRSRTVSLQLGAVQSLLQPRHGSSAKLIECRGHQGDEWPSKPLKRDVGRVVDASLLGARGCEENGVLGGGCA